MQEIKLNGWIAEDKDGEQSFYTTKPEILDKWWKNDDETSYYLPIRPDLGKDWRKSLRRVINNVVQEPRPELKVDDPVLVRNRNDHEWIPGHFAGWDKEGFIQTFANGTTSFSKEPTDLVSWFSYRLPEASSNE